MSRHRRWIMAALLLLPGSALAQLDRPRDPVPPRPEVPSPRPRLPDTTPPSVIVPPAGQVDPGIQAPAPVPAPGTTPVIPPPGTPGGDPRVQPR